MAYQRVLEIAQQLAQLSNFHSLSCLLRFLGYDDVKKLVKVEAEQLEDLWTRAGERDRAQYDAALQKEHDAGDKAAVPNIHVEITSGVRRVSEPDYIGGLINWSKVLPHARRCATLNYFQERVYKFTVVPQIRKVILKGAELVESAIQDKLDELVRATAKE
jgi:hypothetical protein